jgi:hypothetical protein
MALDESISKNDCKKVIREFFSGIQLLLF